MLDSSAAAVMFFTTRVFLLGRGHRQSRANRARQREARCDRAHDHCIRVVWRRKPGLVRRSAAALWQLHGLDARGSQRGGQPRQ
jgi:hypothetical protein